MRDHQAMHRILAGVRRQTPWLIAATLCLLGTSGARAQGAFGYAEPFPGTVRTLLVDNQAATGAQLYGSIGILEREIIPRTKRRGLVGLSAFDMLLGGVQVPGGCPICTPPYRLLPADTYAISTGIGMMLGEHFMVFGSAAGTYTRIAEGSEALIGSMMWPVVGTLFIPLSEFALPITPLFTGPTQIIGGRSTANMLSYVAGGSASFYGMSLTAGLIGSGKGAGLYTNVTQERLRLLVSTALTNEFGDLSYLKFGLDKLPDGMLGHLDSLFDFSGRDESQQGDASTSFYGRKLQFLIPRQSGPSVAFEVSRLSFWSMQAGRTNMLDGWLDADLAAGVKPSVMLHEARVAVHNPQFESEGTGLSIALGVVRLPELYMLAQQPGQHFSVHIELRIFDVLRFSVLRNEPEILTSFPYAYDAWSVSLAMDVTRMWMENAR